MDIEYYNTCADVSDTDLPRFFQAYQAKFIFFCKVYNEQRKKYGQTKKAVTECIPALTFDELKELEAEVMQLA